MNTNFYSPRQVAEVLGCKYADVLALIRLNHIPYTLFNGRYLINPDAVEAYKQKVVLYGDNAKDSI